MKVLLYSGGMDSWLIDKIWKPDVKIYIDIEGSYSKEEIARLPKDVKIVKLPIGIYEQENKFVPLRNLYFLMVNFALTAYKLNLRLWFFGFGFRFRLLGLRRNRF